MIDGSSATAQSGNIVAGALSPAEGDGPSGQLAADIRLTARLSSLADNYHREGKREEAESLYMRVLSIKEKASGPEDPSVLSSLAQLAALYDAHGAYGKAIPIYERIVSSWEKNAAAAEKTLLARSLNDLATCYAADGQLDRAKKAYNRSLSILENMFGPEHPQVVDLLERLACLTARDITGGTAVETDSNDSLSRQDRLYEMAAFYHGKGGYREAARLYRRLLAGSAAAPRDRGESAEDELVSGPRHDPDSLPIAQMLHSLARVHRLQGKYSEAESLCKRALVVRINVLGEGHPEVAQSIEELGELYYCLGRYRQSAGLFRRSLAVRKNVLGACHQFVAQSLSNLAMAYRAQGKYREAEALLSDAVGILRKKDLLGSSLYAQILNNFADLYCARGCLDHAELVLRQALVIEETSSSDKRDHSEFVLYPPARGQGASPMATSPIDIEPGGTAEPRFTESEAKVLRLIAEGNSNQEISTRLGLSRETVNVCLASMLRKLEASPQDAISRFLRAFMAD